MHLLTAFVLALLGALNVHAITNQGTPCLSGCSKWSNSLKTCYGLFGPSPHNMGYNYSNEFLVCLCEGTHLDNGENVKWGNETMSQAAGICQSCATTPREIKLDLSTFLTLCVIQARNGTAANATTFAPLQYTTADDPKVGIMNQNNVSSGSRATPLAAFLALVLLATFATA